MLCCVRVGAFIINPWGERGRHRVCFTCVWGRQDTEQMCVEGGSGGGRAAVVCSVGM